MEKRWKMFFLFLKICINLLAKAALYRGKVTEFIKKDLCSYCFIANVLSMYSDHTLNGYAVSKQKAHIAFNKFHTFNNKLLNFTQITFNKDHTLTRISL